MYLPELSQAVLVLAEEWKEGLQSHEGRIQLNVQKDSNGIENVLCGHGLSLVEILEVVEKLPLIAIDTSAVVSTLVLATYHTALCVCVCAGIFHVNIYDGQLLSGLLIENVETLGIKFSLVCCMAEGGKRDYPNTQVAPIIKERMMKKGSMMFGYQPHQGKVNFFCQVVISPHVS
ncbi:hypothetical protein Q9966_010848 [Columba livia]|nr:hypothetical protein Q9966_010848 [Columba livia]